MLPVLPSSLASSLRPHNGPADMNRAAAAPHRQIKWRADRGVRGDALELRRQLCRIALRPYHDGAVLAQIGKVDPWRAYRRSIDQHLRLVRRIMREITAVPHRADDIAQRRPGRVVKALGEIGAERVAREQHGA